MPYSIASCTMPYSIASCSMAFGAHTALCHKCNPGPRVRADMIDIREVDVSTKKTFYKRLQQT